MKVLNTKYFGNENLKDFIFHNKIAEEKHILLQIFTGICEIEFIEKLIKSIKELIPHINIIGSTTSGEILGDLAYENSVVLSFSFFENTRISTYFTEVSADSYKTAQNLLSQLNNDEIPKVAITFADGLHVNGEEYLNAFSDDKRDIIIAGGLAGDNAAFTGTMVFTQEGVLVNGAVVAFLFSETLLVKTKASFGWENIGKTMTVTKAIKNVVYEVDNINIIDIYAKYLGDDIASLLPKTGIEFPLIIQRKGLNIPRAVIGRDSDSLIFAGNLNVGDKVTFGYGNIESILDYGKDVSSDRNVLNSEAIFVYSCMARKALLQDTIQSELTPLSNISPVSGFFTYGEFFSSSENHELLNQTMTILSLSESNLKKDSRHPSLSNQNTFQERREQNLTLKALSHLISQTSMELEEINSSLLNRVKIEVERNRAQDQKFIEQSRLAQMGEMMSMIAHQWRQPLAAISSLGSGINLKARLGNLDNKTILKLSSDITSHSKHLSETIDDFREFFRHNKEKRETNFNEIVKGVLNIVEASISTQNIKLIKELECESNFNTYPNEIKQVVLNLLKNAEDALLENTIEHPFIKIRSYKKNNHSILEISDNAGGIAENIIDNIFDPYFSTKMKKDGTGLGLYMSKTIIEEHCDGLLHVKNSDKGAVFTIDFPSNNS